MRFSSNRWRAFYEQYLTLTPVNEQGWCNFPCVLPTHPRKDRGTHGAVNIHSGSYRCWNPACVAAYAEMVGRPDAQVLTPSEFLHVVYRIEPDEADRIAGSYAQANRDEVDDAGLRTVEDWSKAYPGELDDALEYLVEAQARISPELDIVQHYCNSRGLEYATLVAVGAGYVPEDDEQEECLLLPYYLSGKVVGLRARAFDGRKTAAKNSWLTLYNLQTLDEVADEGPAVVLVEGETDCLVVQQVLRNHNIDHVPVLGTPGVRFEVEWARLLQGFEYVYVVPQADRAARKLVQDVVQCVGDERVKVVSLPWGARQWGKDVADFVLQNGPGKLLRALALPTTRVAIPRILSGPQLIHYATAEPQWIVPNLIERGTKLLLVGQPKTYKTWLALQLAHAVTSQTAFLGIPDWTPTEKNLRTLLIEEEGAFHRLSERVLLVTKGQVAAESFFMHRQAIRVDDDTCLMKLCDDVAEVRPDLIIFDPYAEIHNQDENQVQGTQRVVQALNHILHVQPQAAILLIHHTPKYGTGARGSTALFAAVDTQIEVLSRDTYLELRITGRDLLPGVDEGLRLVFDPALGRHKVVDECDILTSRRQLATDDIIGYVSQHPGAVVDDIALDLSASTSTVRSHAQTLVAQGHLRTRGSGKRGDPLRYFSVDGQQPTPESEEGG